MAYHETYWAAIAAAAPVIALANTLSITDVTSLWISTKKRQSQPFRIFSRAFRPYYAFRQYYILIIFVAVTNLLLQAIALNMALRSLLAEKDFANASLAGFFLIVGLVYVLAMVSLIAAVRYVQHRREEREKEAESREANKDSKLASGLGWPHVPPSS
jgi:hypothetical protein